MLKYKNQKLAEQLEVHRFEFRALESRFNDLKEKQRTHNETLVMVRNYWDHVSYSSLVQFTITYIPTYRLSAEIPLSKQLIRDLESVSVCKSESSHSSCGAGLNNVRKGMKLYFMQYDYIRPCIVLESSMEQLRIIFLLAYILSTNEAVNYQYCGTFLFEVFVVLSSFEKKCEKFWYLSAELAVIKFSQITSS